MPEMWPLWNANEWKGPKSILSWDQMIANLFSPIRLNGVTDNYYPLKM